MGPLEKRFSDREIAEVIKQASSIQSGDGAHTGEEGVSLEELVSIGGDLGISAEAIRAAAFAVASASLDRRISFLGESISVSTHRTVTAEVSKEQLVELSGALNVIIGENGTSTTAGGIVTWKSDPFTVLRKGTDMRVEVRPLRGGIHVSARENLEGLAAGVFGGICGGCGLGIGVGVGVGVGVGALGSALFAALFPIGILGLSYLGARFLYKSIVHSRRAQAAALIGKICSILGVEDRPLKPPQVRGPKGS